MISDKQIKTALKNKEIPNTREQLQNISKKKHIRKEFTIFEVEYIKNHYADTRSDIIAEKLRRNIRSVYAKAHSIGLKKSQSFLASKECGRLYPGCGTGKNTRFKKGHVPANKDKKMPTELYKRIEYTFFKKGNIPANAKHDGCLSIRKDKRTGISYVYKRLSMNVWRPLHRIIWEQNNGPIPKKYNVIFKDKDTSNINIHNLACISNATLMKNNSFYKYPKNIQNLIHVKSALTRQINLKLKDGQ